MENSSKIKKIGNVKEIDNDFVPLWNRENTWDEISYPDERKLRKLRMTTEKINVESDKFSVPATFRFKDDTTSLPDLSTTSIATSIADILKNRKFIVCL